MPESRIRRKRTDAVNPDAASKAARSAAARSTGKNEGTVRSTSAAATSVTGSKKAEPEAESTADAKRPRKPVRTGPKPTPRWWVPTMLALMILGLLWIVVFYLSGFRQYPVPQIGAWNLASGFALIIVGFAMTTRWR